MRILELDIENFGVFRNRQLPLDRGLQVVYGANEAGKTTLLHLIRQLLFGFPHRNAYSIHDDAGPLSAKAAIEMDDGQSLWFRRRKGRPDQVVGEIERDGQLVEVDERMLTAMLGNATSDLYNNVFGFSLDELADGTNSLRDANLTEALYGGGVGSIANVQRVREGLESESKRLFNTRSKKSEIYSLLIRLADDEQRWRDAQVSPTRHREMLAQQVNADQAVEALKKRLDQQRSEFNHRQGLLDSFAAHLRWKKAAAALKELPAIDMDEDAPRRFEQLRQQNAEHDKVIRELTTAKERYASAIAKLPPDGAYTQEADAIAALHQQVAQLQNYREAIPARMQEAESLRDAVMTELQGIHSNLSSESVRDLQIGVEHRDAVQRLTDSRAKLDRERTKKKTLLKELKLQQQRWRTVVESSAMDPRTTQAASELAEQHGAYLANRTQLTESVLPEIARIEKETTTAAARLIDLVDDWKQNTLPAPPPSRELIEQTIEQHSCLAKQAEQLDRRRKLAQDRDKNASAELTKLDAQQDALHPDELQQARKTRDDCWLLLLQAEQEDDAAARAQLTALGDGESDPWRVMRRFIDRVDGLADALLSSADLVARRSEINRDLAIARSELAECSQLQTRYDEASRAANEGWGTAWSACGITPAEPAKMPTWLDDYQRWCELQDQLTRTAAKRDSLTTQIESYQARWRELLDSTGIALTEGEPADCPVASAIQWWNGTRETAQQRDLASRELPEIEKRMKKATQELDQIETELEKWAGLWAKVLSQLDFPPHWEPQLVQRVFQSLSEAVSRIRQAETLEKRVSEMKQEQEKAAVQVRKVLERMGAEVSKTPTETVIEQLYRELENERNGQQQKRILQSQLDDALRQLSRRQEEQSETQGKLEHLRKQLQADDEKELQSRLQLAQRRTELRRSMDQAMELLSSLAMQSQAEDVETFLVHLESAEEAELRQQQQTASLRMKEMEADIETAQRKAGAAAAALDGLVDSTDAMRQARELAAHRAKLGQLVDRWAPAALASRLLAMSMDRFERENQPALLQRTGELFRRLTDGRYVNVLRRLDEKQAIAVEDQRGVLKTPARNRGTGAREQLYLAIRLAYVGEYSQRTEPLPMVMDDILVNFDDQRARHALETLREFADRWQILFLTCHERTMELAAGLSIPTTELAIKASPVQPKAEKQKKKRVARKKPAADPANDRQHFLFPRK